MAMPEAEARKLADRIDGLLVRLSGAQARTLITELRQARAALLGQMTLIEAGEEALTWESYRVQQLVAQIDILIADLGRRLSNVILLYPERAAAIGDRYAAGMLQVQLVGSFGVLNRPALVALQQYHLGLIKRVTDDLKAEIRSQLAQGLIQGEGIPQIANRLVKGTALQKGTFPKVEQRARVIARTETIRAFSQGVQWQYEQAGVSRVQWLTARDERVCQWCGPLDGQVFPLDRLPTASGPPIHPQCLPGDTRVAAFDVSAATKRPYDGDLVVISTASGKHLSCTPNHPILTPEGWIAAGLLDVGSYVISSGSREWVISGDHECEDVPPRIEEVAEAVGGSPEMTAVPVPVAPEDFHGDGKGSKVAVVWANRLLMSDLNTSLLEHGGQSPFGFGDMQAAFLDSQSVANLALYGLRPSHGGPMCCSHLAPALLSSHPFPFDGFGPALSARFDATFKKSSANDISCDAELSGQGIFGNTVQVVGDDPVAGQRDTLSELDTSFDQASADDATTDAELAAQILAGAAGLVFPDEIVDIQRQSFHGDVFNLQTSTGAYVANGIVTHNCRCYLRAVIAQTPDEGRLLDKQARANARREQKRLAERTTKKRKAVS